MQNRNAHEPNTVKYFCKMINRKLAMMIHSICMHIYYIHFMPHVLFYWWLDKLALSALTNVRFTFTTMHVIAICILCYYLNNEQVIFPTI